MLSTRLFRRDKAGPLRVTLAVTALLLASLPPLAFGQRPGAFAVTGARIVTGTGKTIENGTVVFRGGLITDVGESAKAPADARIIDGKGLTVYPGLIDCFTNLGFPAQATPQPAGGFGGRREAQQQAPAAGAQQQTEELRHGDASRSAAEEVKPGGTAIEDARSAGITAALTSSRQGIFAGQSALINLAGTESAKMVVKAPIALTVQFSSGGGFGGGYPGSLMGTVSFIRQTLYDAIRYRDESDRYGRIKRGVPRPEYDKKLAALLPVLRGELPVMFVVNNDGDIRRAFIIADEFKLKPMIEGALSNTKMADVLKTRNVPLILSLDFPRRAADATDDDEDSLRVLRDRANAPGGAARLAQAGVKFAFTAGSLSPRDFLANVQKAVESGLSKDQALQALTTDAAAIVGASDQLGSIEVGKIANLVVTSGDLLARDTRVRHVFIDGEEIELRRPDVPQRGPQQGRPGARPGPASTDASTDPAGEWALTVQSPDGPINATLILSHQGNGFGGSLSSHLGIAQVRSGAVNGNELRCT
ncbi:MAG TPA: amidohydrolase family protein, partial [Blastocatellia bacterium]|nr:amidohydrolase family protein [Blastocatellia bacterium]